MTITRKPRIETIRDLSELPAGQSAVLDTGADLPRLVHRREDGSLTEVAAVIVLREHPPVRCVATLTAIGPLNPGFYTLPMTGREGRQYFDDATSQFIAPVDGLYRVTTKLRVNDDAPAGLSIGQGAAPFPQDGPWFLWGQTNAAKRQGILNTRDVTLMAGDRLVMYSYYDEAPQLYLQGAEMSIVRVVGEAYVGD